MSDRRYDTEDLLYLMGRLRDPSNGCPWDLQQSFATIVPCTLEECYELAAAIESEDFDHVREELGDVLFQVVFYAQLGTEQSLFDFADIVHGLVEKLVRRHPHVFADGTLESAPPQNAVTTEQIRENWESIKISERHAKLQTGALADVPINLPALTRGQKIQRRAASVGFDWESTAGVVSKLEEELIEFKEALANDSKSAQLAELGDLLFTCVNMIRHLDGDAEAVMRAATAKFESRFEHVEAALLRDNLAVSDVSPEVLNDLWVIAKGGDAAE